MQRNLRISTLRDDIAVHGRQQGQQAVLLRVGDTPCIHRGLQVSMQRNLRISTLRDDIAVHGRQQGQQAVLLRVGDTGPKATDKPADPIIVHPDVRKMLLTTRAYAEGGPKDRIQSRSLTGPKATDKPADPIIVHPDVRKMLLTTRAYAEGGPSATARAA
ncbi:hypothetical protein [Mycobacterium tuberculosis]|uniref:hypothetical protein n=1 Tax=Mycobacterium tuberculosis TaxID=1773 RepID=UPI00272B0F89|nr:hypothetical protein [Mycobacterium tuberculosis]